MRFGESEIKSVRAMCSLSVRASPATARQPRAAECGLVRASLLAAG